MLEASGSGTEYERLSPSLSFHCLYPCLIQKKVPIYCTSLNSGVIFFRHHFNFSSPEQSSRRAIVLPLASALASALAKC